MLGDWPLDVKVGKKRHILMFELKTSSSTYEDLLRSLYGPTTLFLRLICFLLLSPIEYQLEL